MKRRGFLLGAGALAAAPLLPAVPVGAAPLKTLTVPAGIIVRTAVPAWATGGIANTTHHLWFIKNAKGFMDILATRDGQEPNVIPEGWEIVPSPFEKSRPKRRKRQLN